MIRQNKLQLTFPAITLEECKSMSVKEIVFKICIESDILTEEDIQDKSKIFLRVNEFTDLCLKALNLESNRMKNKVKKGYQPPLEIYNEKAVKADKVIELMVQKIMFSLPDFYIH